MTRSEVPARLLARTPAEQTRRLLLRGTSGIVGRCRDFTREALADWQWLPGADGPGDAAADGRPGAPDGSGGDRAPDEERRAVAEDVLLMVSEVVTNACLHAGGPTELVLHHTPDRLRVEVGDRSPDPPRIRQSGDPARPGGHGLVVLDRLSRAWGWQSVGAGKTVWLEVTPPAGPPAGPPAAPRASG